MLHFCRILCLCLYEYHFLDFFEFLLSFTCISSCPSTISIFINISLLSHAWNCFSRTIVDSETRLTYMHVVPFSKSVIHHFHAWSLTYAYTHYHHAFTSLFSFSCPSAGLGSLSPDSASPRQHCAIMRGKALPYSHKMWISTQWMSSSIALRNSER